MSTTGASNSAPGAPCLDYRTKSQTNRLPREKRSHAKVYNRVRVFAGGEIECRTVMTEAASRPPPPPSQRTRLTHGCTSRGRALIRRAVAARVASSTPKVSLYTLTSRQTMPDAEFRKRLESWLAYARKLSPHQMSDYVCVLELQKRGTLHAHIMLFDDLPPSVWLRLRRLWAEHYEMGPGSFDCKRVKRPKRAAGYLAKYITKGKQGREGYARTTFEGNAYRLSSALRQYAAPIAEHHLLWGDPAALRFGVNLRGGVVFHDSKSAALDWLSEHLQLVRAGLSNTPYLGAASITA